MLSFELSAIDIVLTIAVIILFTLHLTRSSTETTAKPKPSTNTKILRQGRDVPIEERKDKNNTETLKCPKTFGYLANLPENASIPDACFGCSRMLECSSEKK